VWRLLRRVSPPPAQACLSTSCLLSLECVLLSLECILFVGAAIAQACLHLLALIVTDISARQVLHPPKLNPKAKPPGS
jgi:hypothetical protein